MDFSVGSEYFLLGYQFDYVFDWTILKYPQIGGSSRGRVNTCDFFLWYIILFCLHRFVILVSGSICSTQVGKLQLLQDHLQKGQRELQVCFLEVFPIQSFCYFFFKRTKKNFQKYSCSLIFEHITYYLLVLFVEVGKEIRERLSGAVEAFSRRNISSSSPHVDHSKQKTCEDVVNHFH